MDPKISIIIPVYNVEKYLPECFHSVRNQTYKNVEIILVDDGSTDNSGRMCDEYAKNRDNIKVIHQENQGLSGARNSGVRFSTGDYICFVDSDDVVTSDYAEVLLNTLADDTDIAITQMMKFYDVIPYEEHVPAKVQALSNEEALKILCNQTKFGNTACAKLYKRYLLEKFPYPVGKLYEDLATTHKIVGMANGICYCPQVTYYYRQRHGSIMNHTGLTQKDLYALEAARDQYEYIKKNYPGAAVAAKGRCVIAGFDLLRLIRGGSETDRSSYSLIREYIKPFYYDVLLSKDVNKKSKIKCVSMIAGYYPAIMCSKLFEYMSAKTIKMRIRCGSL